jgi:hypothetical protein
MLGASAFSLPSLMYYPNEMIWTQMGPPLFLLFLFGAWRFASHVAPEHRNLLLVWIASIYLIQTPISHRAPHNLIGILIPAALISAIGIASLRRYRHLAVALVCCFVSFQLAILTLPEPKLGARVGTFGWSSVVTPFPRTEDWKISSVLHSLGRSRARVVVVSDHLFFNGTTLQFYAMQDDLPLDISPCWRLGRRPDTADFTGFDFLITKADDAWIKRKVDGCFAGPDGLAEYAALVSLLEDGSAGFRRIESVALPDGSSVLVFASERRYTPVTAVTKPGM